MAYLQVRGRLTFGQAASAIETFLADESDELVTPATQAGATVRMIEDRELLRAHGGVAAALRFRS